MNRLKISELKLLKVAELKEMMPVEITSDGVVLGVFGAPKDYGHVKTKCPNCKFVYTVEEPDNQPYFFTLQHG